MTSEQTLEETKQTAINMLGEALLAVSNTEPVWDETRKQLGFNNVTYDLTLELIEPRYGKITTFDFSVLADKDEYTIVLYYQPGCNVHGYGVLSADKNVCIETTITDLVEWLVPMEYSKFEDIPLHVGLLHEVVVAARELIP